MTRPPPPREMPPETATSLRRALSGLDLHGPFTREQVMEQAGNEIIRAGDRRFVLKSALQFVPEGTFFDSHSLSDALAAHWDDVRRVLY